MKADHAGKFLILNTFFFSEERLQFFLEVTLQLILAPHQTLIYVALPQANSLPKPVFAWAVLHSQSIRRGLGESDIFLQFMLSRDQTNEAAPQGLFIFGCGCTRDSPINIIARGLDRFLGIVEYSSLNLLVRLSAGPGFWIDDSVQLDSTHDFVVANVLDRIASLFAHFL